MDKKLVFFALCALMAGTLLGYTGKSLKRDMDSAEKTDSAKQGEIRPRFGDGLSPGSHRTASTSGSAESTGIDQALKRIARMSPEELWKEQEKWNGQNNGLYYRPQSIERQILTSYIFTRLGQESPRQTLQQIEKKNPSGPFFQYGILEVWSKKNPEAVLAYCQEQMEGDVQKKRFFKSSYVSALSRLSPDKAMDYLSTLPKREQSRYLPTPLSQIAKKTPEKMPEIMQKLTPVLQDSKWESMSIAMNWAKQDWDAATQWINTLPENKRDEVMVNTVRTLSTEDLIQKLPSLNDNIKETAVQQIISGLWKESSSKALDWLQSRMPEEEAAKTIDNSYYWENYYNSEFTDYLDRMPAGALKDSLLKKVLNSMNPYDSQFGFMDMKMEDTFATIGKISSQETRKQLLENTLGTWSYYDPQNVKAWVEKSDMPAEKKKEYLERCDIYIRSQEE